MNVKFFDRRLLKSFSAFVSGISVVLSLLLIFIDIPRTWKVSVGIVFVIFLSIVYVGMLIRANLMSSVTLRFGNSEVRVFFGDLFDEDGLKAISFNEYFDEIVDDKVISRNSINGKYLDRLHGEELTEVQKRLSASENTRDIVEKDVARPEGKHIRYALGTVVELPNQYLATAGSKFSKDNKAGLTMSEYIAFLMHFWDEIDRVYNGRTVSIPVFGSGILRFRGGYDEVSDQELLQIILWTFKVSKIKFTYPAKLKIVVYRKKLVKYSLYKLKEIEKNGIS